MKKNLLVLVGLFMANSMFATKFENATGDLDLRVMGRGGLWYTVSKAEPFKTFQTGIQDNLVIKAGYLYKGELVPAPGVPYAVRFDLAGLKKHFSTVNTVILEQLGAGNRGDFRFRLSMIGKPKGDVQDIALYLTSKECKMPWHDKPVCMVNPNRTNSSLTIEMIVPIEVMYKSGIWEFERPTR